MVYVLFVVGIFLLIKCADWIVDGSSSLAKRFGVSSLIIGLTVVAFGTSLPELVVNLFAVMRGASEISFGNIIGSNISNVLLILGVTAIVGNVRVKSETIWRQIPFALLSVFVLFVLVGKVFFGEGDYFTWRDGLILLALFVMFLYYVFQMAMRDKKVIGFPKDSDESGFWIAFKLIVGLVGIYFGGKFVVNGAVFIAGQFGLSEFLISATIIAIGTSLPELAVCVVAVLKKNMGLVVGNIVGSNIFNVLWVFGFIPFFGDIKIPVFVLIDIAMMFFATLLLFIFMFIGKKHVLRKKDGIVFVLLYVLYVVFLIYRG